MSGDESDFVVIDVETANADYASICQIGIVKFNAEGPLEEWSSYIDPEDDFDGFNVSIHGIDPSMVAGAPTFVGALPQLAGHLESNLVLSYSWFDRSAVWQAHEKYGLAVPSYNWLDVTRIVRRTWLDIAHGGFRLKNVAKRLGIKMERHHDALSDARTAGSIVLEALRQSGKSLAEWRSAAFKSITKPLSVNDVAASVPEDEIDHDGPLSGETVVFTGALSIPRNEAF